MKQNLKKGLVIGIVYVIIKWSILGVLGTYLYKKGLWSNWYLLILPVIGLVVFFIQKKKKGISGNGKI